MTSMAEVRRPVGRCMGCFHDFATGPCGGCGAVLEYSNPPVDLGFMSLPPIVVVNEARCRWCTRHIKRDDTGWYHEWSGRQACASSTVAEPEEA